MALVLGFGEVVGDAQAADFLDEAFHCSDCSFSLSLVSHPLLLRLLGHLLRDVVGLLEVLVDVNAAVFGHHALHFHLAAAFFSAQELLILTNVLNCSRQLVQEGSFVEFVDIEGELDFLLLLLLLLHEIDNSVQERPPAHL